MKTHFRKGWIQHNENLFVRNGGGCIRYVDGLWYACPVAYPEHDIKDAIGMFTDYQDAMTCVENRYTDLF